MQRALLLAAVVVLSAAHTSTTLSPTAKPPSEAAPTAATTANVSDSTASSHDASSTLPSERERASRPADFVPSPQLEPGASDAAVDGWLVSAPLPLRQPPLQSTGRRAAAASHALYATPLADAIPHTPAPEHQDSGFRPMVHHKLRGSVLPETPSGAVPAQRASVVAAEVADPVQEYLDAMRAQLVHHGEAPATAGSTKYHGQEGDYTSVQEYLKAVHADFAAVHQQQLQQQGDVDFPAVWGESKVRGKPVRFEEDVSQTRPLPPEAPRGGGFPYLYERPEAGIPEVAVPSPIGPKHYGKKKIGVARPSPRSGLVQKVLHALAAFIPLGLFLASIQPSVITVNASAPAPGVSRQRSLVGGAAAAEAGVPLSAGAAGVPLSAGEAGVPLSAGEAGVPLSAGAECEARLLCEAAVRGRREAADVQERALWLAAHQTPDKMAEALGLYEILKAIRTGTCDLINCHALQNEQFASSL